MAFTRADVADDGTNPCSVIVASIAVLRVGLAAAVQADRTGYVICTGRNDIGD